LEDLNIYNFHALKIFGEKKKVIQKFFPNDFISGIALLPNLKILKLSHHWFDEEKSPIKCSSKFVNLTTLDIKRETYVSPQIMSIIQCFTKLETIIANDSLISKLTS